MEGQTPESAARKKVRLLFSSASKDKACVSDWVVWSEEDVLGKIRGMAREDDTECVRKFQDALAGARLLYANEDMERFFGRHEAALSQQCTICADYLLAYEALELPHLECKKFDDPDCADGSRMRYNLECYRLVRACYRDVVGRVVLGFIGGADSRASWDRAVQTVLCLSMSGDKLSSQLVNTFCILQSEMASCSPGSRRPLAAARVKETAGEVVSFVGEWEGLCPPGLRRPAVASRPVKQTAREDVSFVGEWELDPLMLKIDQRWSQLLWHDIDAYRQVDEFAGASSAGDLADLVTLTVFR